MRAWIVKDALTKGIFQVNGIEKQNGIFVASGLGYLSFELYHGENKEWCRTREMAIAIAEKKRAERIKSLTKQIEKLRAIEFDV